MNDAPRTLYVAEPPAPLYVRPCIVVDSSVLCAVLFDEPERADAEQMLTLRRLVAPHLLDHEVVNVALKKQRRGMPEAAVERALADYAAHVIDFAATDVTQQHAIAQRFDLSGYDAAYLWLAGELRVPLATLDRRLADAAQRYLSSLQ